MFLAAFRSFVFVALTLLVAIPGGLAAQEASPAAPPGEGAAATLIAEYAAALTAHDPDRVAAFYAEDAAAEQIVREGGVFRGRSEIRGLIAANPRGIPDLVVSTESVIDQGDRIAWAWRHDGAYTGQFPGLPAGQG